MSSEQLSMQLQMARQYLQIGRMEQAGQVLTSVLSQDPGNVEVINLLVNIYTDGHQVHRALDLLRDATGRVPDNADLMRLYASRLASNGDFPEAAAAYRRVLELRPDRAEIYLKLALINKYTAYSDEIKSMEQLFAAAAIDSPARRSLAFALGKAFDDIGEYDQAFGFFVEGNRIARLGNSRPFSAIIGDFNITREAFSPHFTAAHAGAGCPDESPVFIAGLPRSGTTLVEEILGSHPQVHAGGESGLLSGVLAGLFPPPGFPVGLDQLTPAQITAAGAEYLRRSRVSAPDDRLITNKSIDTVFYVGLIAAMLPKAKIIICERDPLDQALSFFQKDFGNSLPFYYDLWQLGQRHHSYAALVAHWDRLLPDRLLRVQYEEVVADQEGWTRRLLDFCDLEFDPACLSFYESDRPVATLSLAQVRQPVYNSSIGRWKNYEKHLQPLIHSLSQKPGAGTHGL